MPTDPDGPTRPNPVARAPEARADAAALPLISGRYRSEKALGEGGMASVLCVLDVESGHKLALKRLTRTTNSKLRALFEREFHILASLRHPSIVRAFDYASDAEGPYYTMELLEGSDVSSLAPKPWPLVCKILRDVASGIALLHARRLLHRDLSARNIWLTPEGAIKLIDFGTMTTFGKPADIVGTPPFVAPEAVHGLELDQRSDLYALGALGYFLLTGRHAFPARSLSTLEASWKERPRPASRRVAELSREDLPEVPATLDALLESLLSQDPLARPTTAADLIDRLTVIAGLEPEQPVRVLDSYLSAPTFIGRSSERAALRAAFDTARAGRATNVTVEAAAGLGRTRILNEVALEARLCGATVLQAEPRADQGTHDVALELSLRLLTALPGPARAAAAPHATTLGHLSSTLREKLGVRPEELAEMPHTHGEARMRVQGALRDWFLDVAREHLVVIVADDLDSFDDGSAAWLAALSRAAKAHHLLIAAGLSTERAPYGLPVQALRQNAQRLVLEPLSHAETLELFRSVFGDVQYMARLVDRIHQRAEGNPGHAIDLAEHLSRDGVIAYADGAWLLPQNVDEVALPANRADAEIARIARLPAEVRRIGQSLSIREGAIPLPMCACITDRAGAPLFDALEELVRAGVLLGSADGYRFVRDSLRLALHAELEPEQKRQAHLRLGRLLLSASELSELERLKAGVHLLQGGDDVEGSRVVALAGQHYGLVDLADLGPAAPALETALRHFRSAQRPAHELASVLAPLALAGYYADKRLAARYGMETVELLQRLVGLGLARRLSPLLGRKFGLLLALLWSAIGFALRAKNPRVPKFRQAMMMLFNCVAALTGASVVCFDLRSAQRYAKVLQPMTALGPNHVATFMYHFCQNLIGTIQDHAGDARSRWIHMIERLDRPNALRDLGDVHVLYLAGALYARGVGECRRDDSAAVACAERLQGFGLKLYDMSADQVRMIYYANRGDLEAFERYSAKVEVHAIQRGTAWQVETWMYSSLMYIHLRTGDVAGLKECAEQLKRISADVPTLASEYTRALASYLVLRGTPAEALRVMDEHPEQPSEIIGWGRCQGVRARALNELKEHARARETCVRALEHLTDEDLASTGNNLGLLIELARAEAGLGDVAAAEARLHELITDQTPFANPLTLGTLHEALAELAQLRGDRDAWIEAALEVERWFRPTRHPALIARCDRLAKAQQQGGNGPDAQAEAEEPQLMTVLHNLRHGGDTSITGSAEWTLKQLSGLTEIEEAYLFLSTDDGAVSRVACIRPDEQAGSLNKWVELQLHVLDQDQVTCTLGMDEGEQPDALRTSLGAKAYRLIPLRASGRDQKVLGALVVPDLSDVPLQVVQEIAARLQTSVSQHTSI